MADLSPTEYATLRDSVCEAVTKHIATILSDMMKEQDHLIRALIEDRIKAFGEIVGTLQAKQDALAGRFERLESADQYSITRRALMKLLEQTDVA